MKRAGRILPGLGVALTLLSASAALGVQTSIRIAPEFRRWTFVEPGAEHQVEQSYLAADLFALWNSGLRLAVGADLVSAAHDDGSRSGNLDGLGELRVSAERRLAHDRVRVRGGFRLPLYHDAYSDREIRVLERLETPELEFALREPGAGATQVVEVLGQPLRRRTILIQVGLGWERRGSYAIRDDGLKADPGGVLRLLGSIDHSLAGWIVHHGLMLERPGTSALGGRDAFRVGSRYLIGEAITRTQGAQTWSASVSLALAQSGELFSGTSLAAGPLRAGNRIRWAIAQERSTAWPTRLTLSGTHYRGFSGTVGHSDWVTPAGTIGHGLGPGIVEMTIDLSVGRVREGGNLRGLGMRLAWQGGLQ